MPRTPRPVDDLVWLEGFKPWSDGTPAWQCIYCWREADLLKARSTLNRIQQMRSLGSKLPDGLGDFSDFRLKMPGEISDALDTLEEIRNNPGGWALLRVLEMYYPPCGKLNKSTGGICQQTKNHNRKVKHSSTVKSKV